MMKILLLTSLFSFLNFGLIYNSVSDEEWKFVKEEKGIKLYNRTIKGFEYKEVKAVLDLHTDLSKAKSYLFNPANIEKWMSGCTMSIAKKSFKNTKEYYAIFDAPWPISDRDDYGAMRIHQHDEKVLHIDFKSVPHGTPPVTSMVRVPFSKGHIRIETTANGKKTLIYQMLVDRGGTLPAYLKDYLETSSPVKTVEKLKVILEAL